MARRQILSLLERESLLALPDDELTRTLPLSWRKGVHRQNTAGLYYTPAVDGDAHR